MGVVGGLRMYSGVNGITTYLTLSTSNSTTNNEEQVRITSDGHLLVNTTSEGGGSYDQLTVAGGIKITDDSNSKLEIGRYSSSSAHSYIKIGSNSGSLRITNAADSSDLVTLTNSGSVGIGITSPNADLDIATSVEDSTGTLSAHGIRLSHVGATDEEVIPITAGFVTQVDRARAGIGFISKIASATEGYAGEIGFYTRSAADGTGLLRSDERMRITSSGRLLIGTTAHNGPYDGITPQVVLEGTSYNTSTLTLFCNANAVGPAPQLQLGKSRGTTDGSNTIVANGDRLASIWIVGADGTDRNSSFAAFDFRVDGVPGVNDTPGRIEFKTTSDGSANPSERMRLNSSGRLVIGTTVASGAGNSQYSLFEVSGNTSGATGPGHLSIKRGTASASLSNGDTIGRLIFSGLDGGDFAFIQASVDADNTTDFPARLMFYTCADGATSATERMRIDHSGKVGVNNTSLNADFSVSNSNTSQNSAFVDIGKAGGERFKLGYEGNNCFFGGSASSAMFIFKNNVTQSQNPQASGNERMRLDGSGRLMVGTTTSTSNQSGRLNVFGTDGDSAYISVRRGSDNASGPRFAMCKSRKYY